jgi:hypothetical protein
MRTFLRGKATLLFMMLGMLIAIPTVALADNIVNDIDTTVHADSVVNATVGQTVKVGYLIQATGAGQICDAADGSKATLTPSKESGPGTVAVSPTSQDYTACDTSKTFDFKADTPGDYVIAVAVADTNGDYNTTTGKWKLRVAAAGGGNAGPTANAGGSYTFDEGSATNALSGSGTDPEDDAASPPVSLTYAWDLDNNGSFETSGQNPNFDATNIDGPATRTVTFRVTDSGGLSDTDSATVTINNVAPTVSSVSASSQNALVNKNVTFTGTATDPSSADTAAKFFWQWSTDGTNYSPSLPSPFLVPNTYSNEYTTSFADCGSKSVSAKATDKDLGTSLPKTSSSVNVYNASFSPPVDAAPYVNTVQKGRVIPVKISVSCNGNIANLSPSIQLLSGDQSAGNETTADEIETYSVSSADTTGVMRAADGGYIYNLRVPDVANATYTIRVNAFGGSNASSNMYALLKTRK